MNQRFPVHKWIPILAIASLLLLAVLELLRMYLLMPFPGSQELENSLGLAYFLDRKISLFKWGIGISGFLLGLWVLGKGKRFSKISIGFLIVLLGYIFYLGNHRFSAERMFLPPGAKDFLHALDNEVDLQKVVIGLDHEGEAKAYPLEMVAYHHVIQDSIGGEAAMVTYCSVCRTARVFSPKVHGQPESFRIVGMNQYNAMIEDQTTQSWWQQATGEAVAGPLKGQHLDEFLSQQMKLEAWIRSHPNTQILQWDSTFQEDYDFLDGYDAGLLTNSLEKTDSIAWMEKSWVIGIQGEAWAKAYDYLMLREQRIIQDAPNGEPLMIVLETDSLSFHVFDRRIEDQTLDFALTNSVSMLMDQQTSSFWNAKGECVEGALEGKQLKARQAYLEYWHSWRTFRKGTEREQ